MSITAVGGDKLRQVGITGVSRSHEDRTGICISAERIWLSILTLRGVGLRDKAIAASPTVAVYVDQSPCPSPK